MSQNSKITPVKRKYCNNKLDIISLVKLRNLLDQTNLHLDRIGSYSKSNWKHVKSN